MFSTSVLECHKSLDQAMKQSVLTENLPDRASKRPSWPSRLGPGLFASDKENRPETEALEMKVTKSAWWLQQREADALKQQQLQQRLRAGAEEQLQHVRSARRSEGGALEPSDSGLRRRCQELERERDSLELRAKAARRLEAELEAEKAKSARLAQLLRGSEAATCRLGLHEMSEQVKYLSRQADLHEEQLAFISNRRTASALVRSIVQRVLARQSPEAEVCGALDVAVQAELGTEAEELSTLRSELADARAAAEVRRSCGREVREGLQKDCERWRRHAEGLEKQVDQLGRSMQGCETCTAMLAESQELALTITALKNQCDGLEVERKSLASKVDSLQESLEEVSSSHAELAGHANHRQKIRHTLQLKDDRDSYREENFRLKQRILQLEARNSSQGIVQAVAGHSGSELRGSRVSRLSSRPASRGGTDGLDGSQRCLQKRCQQLERELERNKINVTHFLAIIERAVPSKGGAQKPKDDTYAATSREMMERQNDEAIEDLEAKVGQLKDITRNIGSSIKDSNSLLDQMGIDFDKAAGLLKGTLGNLKGMMANKSSKHMIYMVLFVVCLFLLMYFLRKMSFGGSGGAASIQLKENASSGD
ncbi:BET12 [Symbiodinium sp. CCMP2456]|nr:BET12 [Symbiodinium sp. CCMP2456]